MLFEIIYRRNTGVQNASRNAEHRRWKIEGGLLVPIDANTYIKSMIPEQDENENDETGVDDNMNTAVNSIDFKKATGSTDEKHSWSYNKTVCIINSMEAHANELNRPKKRKFVFDNISNDLLSSGFSINAVTCQNKWKNLLRSYKVVKDNKNKTGRGPSGFHFFDQMDSLLGEKPSNRCSHSLESSNLDNLEDRDESTTSATDKPQMEAPKKRVRCNNTAQKDFVALKQEEYQRKQQRHNEKLNIEKQKLDIEKYKLNLLKQLSDMP